MSARNTALLLPGHWPSQDVLAIFWSAPNLVREHFAGPEHPRVCHGVRDAAAYTLLRLRLFEVAGLQLMDSPTLPAPDDLEQYLGCALSDLAGTAVFVFYDEEHGAGGAAVFSQGALQSRRCFDARGTQPVHREGDQETPLRGLDPSDWIWAPASTTIDAALTPLVGAGIRDDDDIDELIQAAQEVSPPPPTPPPATPPPATPPPASRSRRRLRDRLKGLIGGS